eukprot:6198282-Pleurochrysis_carterae.AAC.1
MYAQATLARRHLSFLSSISSSAPASCECSSSTHPIAARFENMTACMACCSLCSLDCGRAEGSSVAESSDGCMLSASMAAGGVERPSSASWSSSST